MFHELAALVREMKLVGLSSRPNAAYHFSVNEESMGGREAIEKCLRKNGTFKDALAKIEWGRRGQLIVTFVESEYHGWVQGAFSLCMAFALGASEVKEDITAFDSSPVYGDDGSRMNPDLSYGEIDHPRANVVIECSYTQKWHDVREKAD
ncbi:hypothetical protein MNV49_001036 [Pseudohyphozyma bogoriensis]|nr:hypothetical protein MNV49_001036 [Pseudohyphozyma bogoriensis]